MSLLEMCLGLDESAVQTLHDVVKAGWRLIGARALSAGNAHPLLDHCGGGLAIYLFEDRRGATRAPELGASDGTGRTLRLQQLRRPAGPPPLPVLGPPRLPIARPQPSPKG